MLEEACIDDFLIFVTIDINIDSKIWGRVGRQSFLHGGQKAPPLVPLLYIKNLFKTCNRLNVYFWEDSRNGLSFYLWIRTTREYKIKVLNYSVIPYITLVTCKHTCGTEPLDSRWLSFNWLTAQRWTLPSRKQTHLYKWKDWILKTIWMTLILFIFGPG